MTPRARAHLEIAIARRARVVASAMTLTEVLRGGPRDAAVHRVLSRITVVPVSPGSVATVANSSE